MAGVDLICWDFGDTLVDERFMRIAPPGVPEWPEVYELVLGLEPGWVERWELGQASMNDLVRPLAERLPMSPGAITAHLRATWTQIEWFPDAREWVERLAGRVEQAVVTVNPHEFAGIAAACGLDELVPTIVTSAELATASKVPMAERARRILGLPDGIGSTVLVDNKEANIAEFGAAGGLTVHYRRGADSLAVLGDLVGDG